MNKQLLVLFDGNALIHRAYHGIQPLSVRRTGEVVNAVYGFAMMLLKILTELKPTNVTIAFDRKGPTFRHHLFSEYKANRPSAPDDLAGQIGRVKELVQAFHIPAYELEGYEADDILGALSDQASKEAIETIIITGDADTLQLVSPNVKVLSPKPGRSFSNTILFDAAAVKEKYGIEPQHIPDLKGLAGDPSDNIPGVPGIGEKTAVKLIQQFGGIDEIYKCIDQVTPARIQNALRDNEERVRRSKELATIKKDIPVLLNLEASRVTHYDRKPVTDFFRELEFSSLLPRLNQLELEAYTGDAPHTTTGTPVRGNYQTVTSEQALNDLVQKLAALKSFALKVETDNISPMLANLVGISFAPQKGEAYYLPIGHGGLEGMMQLPRQLVLDKLKPLLEDAAIAKTAHNGKFDMIVLAESGVNLNNLAFDPMVAAYLLGEKTLSLNTLVFSKLGLEMVQAADLIGTGAKQKSMAEIGIQEVADYSCGAVDLTLQLAENLDAELKKQDLHQLFLDVEMPLVPVLVHMERNGVVLDVELLRRMSIELGDQIVKLEKEIYGWAGHEFNINSPAQLAGVLFDELKLPVARRGKTRPSTDASVLEGLRAVPIVARLLEYRQLTKLKSTYVDALPDLINPKTGRVHTSFNQTRTTTGRLSSSDPNLQNIPVRGELGKKVREAFIAPPGTCLLGGDYSQIDLRVLAHLSQDPRLLDAFRHDEDIHTATAAQLFSVPPDQVTPDMRRLAKTVNFGVIYGMSEFGLEQATELTRSEAARFIDTYFKQYPGVRAYLDATRDSARKNGYVQTMLKRKRYVPEVNASNAQVREAGERMAINMPVQGTSADIIKIAMVNLFRLMNERRLKSKMLLQVHDELVFEVPENELDIMGALAKQTMSSAMELSVPLKIDVKTAKNWGDMK